LLLLLLLLLIHSCSKGHKSEDGSLYGFGSSQDDGSSNEDDGSTTGSDPQAEGTQVTSPTTREKTATKSWDGFVTTPEEVVENDTMTEYAKMLFYHAKPEIVPAEKFLNEHYCGSSAHDDGAVLGCYIPSKSETIEYKAGGTVQLPTDADDSDYIFVRTFSDENLLPEMNVTAAHEMLHAAWGHFPWNLNASMQSKVAKLLRDFYSSNVDLQQRMQPYRDSGMKEDSADFVNELHSIIGTEYEDIGDELEQYYRIYFNNRKKVVGYHKGFRCYLGDLVCL
jgi:hypothetical protein